MIWTDLAVLPIDRLAAEGPCFEFPHGIRQSNKVKRTIETRNFFHCTQNILKKCNYELSCVNVDGSWRRWCALFLRVIYYIPLIEHKYFMKPQICVIETRNKIENERLLHFGNIFKWNIGPCKLFISIGINIINRNYFKHLFSSFLLKYNINHYNFI